MGRVSWISIRILDSADSSVLVLANHTLVLRMFSELAPSALVVNILSMPFESILFLLTNDNRLVVRFLGKIDRPRLEFFGQFHMSEYENPQSFAAF